MSSTALTYVTSDDYEADYLANETVKVVSVSRATSKLDAVAAFYDGINVSTTWTYSSPDVNKRCYLWWNADVEVCYAQRHETTTFYSVSDLETMLNDVHADIIDGGNDIRENFIERNQAIARERLRKEFGADAEEFINATGALDFEALREFLDQQRVNVERLQNLDLGPASLIDIKT